MTEFPEIPNTWIILILAVALVSLRAFGIDSWTTGALGTIIGYLTGKHVESTRLTPCVAPVASPPPVSSPPMPHIPQGVLVLP